MRLDRLGDVAAAAGLLRHAYQMGVSSFHCSSEYESFPLFRDAWGEARRDNLNEASVIAKVAAPHFGEVSFSANAFLDKIDFYLKALRLERLDVVQWLLRYDLKQEDTRLRILSEARDEISSTVAKLKAEGKIGAFVSFPYTPSMADAVLSQDYCDGLAVYVNPLEREMDSQVRRAHDLGKAVVAIRPFAAGRLFQETSLGIDKALDHVFSFPAVATTIISASSREHLDALHPYL